MKSDAEVVGILTGNVLKDPDFIHQYHTGALRGPDGTQIQPNFGNAPVVVANNVEIIENMLQS